MIRPYLVIAIFLLISETMLAKDFNPFNSICLKQKDSTWLKENKVVICNNKLRVAAEYQILNSTHGTRFTGGDVMLEYCYSKSFIIGLGSEFSHSKFHNDNGWNLYNLKFLPVFLDFKWTLTEGKRVIPFFHNSEGISFVGYEKENAFTIDTPHHVAEKGFYFYSGVGILLRLKKHFTPIVDLGFKGYHMSFNNLDINPHGLTLRLGVIF